MYTQIFLIVRSNWFGQPLNYVAIFVMEHHWKNLLATWGLEPASPVSVVNRHALSPRPSCIPKKKDASSQELSNTVFPIRPMSILTSWLTLILLCNQYYSTVVHLLIIYIAIFVMEYHWKNLLATWGLEPASPVSVVNRHA